MSVWPLKEVCSDWPIVRPTMYFCVFVFVFVTCEQKTMCVTSWESFLRLTKSETNIRQEDEPPIAIFGFLYIIYYMYLYIHTYIHVYVYKKYMQIYRNMHFSGSVDILDLEDWRWQQLLNITVIQLRRSYQIYHSPPLVCWSMQNIYCRRFWN